MTLITEDGTGKADAESYVSVADADAYHDARGNATWTGTDAVKEAALRRATAYIEGAYGLRFVGDKYTAAQALSWPRGNAVGRDTYTIDSDVIPGKLADATAEAALRELVTPGTLTPDSERGGAVSETYFKAGPVETSTKYRSDAPAGTAISIISHLLRNLLKGGAGQLRLARG